MPPDERNAPGHHTGGASKNVTSPNTMIPRDRLRLCERNADLATYCAWLRVHADALHKVDNSGLLSGSLLNYAHLLETAQAGGWFE